MSIFTRTLFLVIGTSSSALIFLALLTLNFSHSYIQQTLNNRMDTLIRSQEVKIIQALDGWAETAALVSNSTPILKNTYEYSILNKPETLTPLKTAIDDILVSSGVIVKASIISKTNSPIASSGLLVNIKQTAILRDISKGKVYGFYQLSRSQIGKTYVHMTEPLVYKNELLGVIDLVFDITGFVEDFYNVGGIGETGYAKVITRTATGSWVNILDLVIDENISQQNPDQVNTNMGFYDGALSYFDDARPQYIRVSKLVSSRSVFLEINVNANEVFEEVDLFYKQFFTAFLLVILITAIIGWRFSRKITMPIRHLSKQVSSIAKGGKQITFIKKRNHPTEIKSLATNITTMANSLWQMNVNLELVVEERTSQLRKLTESLEDQVQERTLEFQQANDSLLMTLNELNETKNELVKSEKMASLGGLVAGVAHEINTPLGVAVTGITQCSALLNKLSITKNSGKLTANNFEDYLGQLTEISELITDQLYIASNLIKSFKEVAVDQHNSDIRTVKLAEYIHKVVDTVRPKYRGTNFDIEIDCDESFEFASKIGPFSQVISNMLLNCLYHAFEGKVDGLVRVAVSQYSEGYILLIVDNGIGINPEQLNKIFDPFYTTKRGKGGSGLGLSIVYNIVTEALKGTIKVESEVGKGTTFTLHLPNLRI